MKDLKTPVKKESQLPPVATVNAQQSKSSSTSKPLLGYLDLRDRPHPLIPDSVQRLGPNTVRAVRLLDFCVVEIPIQSLIELQPVPKPDTKNEPEPTDTRPIIDAIVDSPPTNITTFPSATQIGKDVSPL